MVPSIFYESLIPDIENGSSSFVESELLPYGLMGSNLVIIPGIYLTESINTL